MISTVGIVSEVTANSVDHCAAPRLPIPHSDYSPMTVKIKEFMALYGIVDIKMRMLRIPELKKIMGFPEDYVLIGTQADQKKFIGNAVEVTQARKNTEALCKVLKKLRLKKLKEIA